jgi:hypothetical protein
MVVVGFMWLIIVTPVAGCCDEELKLVEFYHISKSDKKYYTCRGNYSKKSFIIM